MLKLNTVLLYKNFGTCVTNRTVNKTTAYSSEMDCIGTAIQRLVMNGDDEPVALTNWIVGSDRFFTPPPPHKGS